MDEIVKAGLSTRMREWMSARTRPFYFAQMCDGLDIPLGPIRYFVLRTLQKFVERGEVQKDAWIPGASERANEKKTMAGELWGAPYTYNHSWRRRTDAPMKEKILRAMRLISFRDSFSVADVQALASAPERSYVDMLIRKLVKDNYVHRVGIRACPHGVGKESLYRVPDLDRFRVDLL